MIVWEGTDDSMGLVPGEQEVFLQRLDDLGSEIGENDMRLTHMGPDDVTSVEAGEPVIALEATEQQYMVAWRSDAATGSMINGEYEIYGAFFAQPACPADVDGDNQVGIGDLLSLLAQWGTDPGGPPDLDGNSIVGIEDFLLLLAAWGRCP